MKYLLAVFAVAASQLSFAEGPAVGADSMGVMGQLIFLGGFLVIFYFLLWRPQSKRQKEHRNLVSTLSAGDEVVTAGGMVGKIVKVTDDFVVLEVSDGVKLPVQKSAVTAALPKGTVKELKA
jgi:preprotein translocase subunit YajC